MTQRANTPRHRTLRPLPANKPSHLFGRWLAPAALVILMLAVFLTPGLQAPPPAEAQEPANVVCQSPPAASCPQYDDDPIPAEITFWSATMTVGMRGQAFGFTFYGWNDHGSFTGASLTDQNFTFGGDTLRPIRTIKYPLLQET